MEILSFHNAETAMQAAADGILKDLRETVRKKNVARLALCGGSTPAGIFDRMAAAPDKEQPDWEHIRIFWEDERWVSPDSEYSNYRLAADHLLSCVPVPEKNIFPVPVTGCKSPAESAEAYEEILLGEFSTAPAPPSTAALSAMGFPVFDIVLGGMGTDGHTASLFPGSPALGETRRWVLAVNKPGLPPLVPRITLTFPVLNAARRYYVVTLGESKRETVWEILSGSHRARELYPAAKLSPAGEFFWLADFTL